jgi:hypothetical protein
MGASNANLLGLDGYTRGKAMYWWQPFRDEDRRTMKAPESPCFKQMKQLSSFLGDRMPVVNYSAVSAYEAWPRQNWRDAFG